MQRKVAIKKIIGLNHDGTDALVNDVVEVTDQQYRDIGPQRLVEVTVSDATALAAQRRDPKTEPAPNPPPIPVAELNLMRPEMKPEPTREDLRHETVRHEPSRPGLAKPVEPPLTGRTR
jgi:hypothetical protein